jgi:hypothetical protein
MDTLYRNQPRWITIRQKLIKLSYLMLRLAALAVASGFVGATKPYFHDETTAFLHLEAVLWPNG